MKILMTLMGMEIGGAETHVAELARELHRRGHEVLIASNGGVYAEELEREGIRHFQIPMHRRDLSNMQKSLRLLRKLIRQEQPGLVHAHARIPAFLCGILQRQMKFPFITTAHWVFEVTPLLRLMTDWGQRTVAVSQDIREYLLWNYQIPADQIHVTINGISTTRFCKNAAPDGLREELSLGNGPVVGLVSRLDTSRAMAAEALLAIAERLSREIPGVELLIVGGGDREATMRQTTEVINRRAGRMLIHMTGPRTDIAELVSLCDVFVGVSRAALEAMSAQRPVILAGDEGYMGVFTSEKLEAAQETNFCLRGSPMLTEEALLQDLTALLRASETQRQELGAFSRQVILDSYSVRRMTDDYEKAYEELLHPKQVKRAAICGYYGYDNLGDEAILQSISQQTEGLPLELHVLSRHPELTRKTLGLRAVQRFNPFAVYRTLCQSDLLIFGGGSLLQDRTSTRSVRYYLWVIRLAQQVGKPVFLYANGIGPLRHPSNRRRVEAALRKCKVISLRDEISREVLDGLGVPTERTCVTGDPAFTMVPETRQQARRRLKEAGVDPDRGIVGISVRPAPGMERAVSEFAALGDRIAAELGRQVVLLVMQDRSDMELSRAIREKMTAPVVILKTPGNPEAMLGLIGELDAVVSLRLHTLLFAAKQRVPVVGCIYDPKVASFLQQLGLPECGSPESMTAEDTFWKLKGLLRDREEIVARLDAEVQPMEERAWQTAVLLEKLLGEMDSSK